MEQDDSKPTMIDLGQAKMKICLTDEMDITASYKDGIQVRKTIKGIAVGYHDGLIVISSIAMSLAMDVEFASALLEQLTTATLEGWNDQYCKAVEGQ